VNILSSEPYRLRRFASELRLSSIAVSLYLSTFSPELGPGRTLSCDVKYLSRERSFVPTNFCSL